jgi:type III pantothenate kinase
VADSAKQATLLCDIGNTNCHWAIARSGVILARGSLPRQDLAPMLEQGAASCGVPSRVLVANVAGPATAAELTGLCRRCWGLTPEYLVAEASAFGVHNGYRRPSQLGVDRWLALVGAYGLEETPACVVDCGTAVTIDLLGNGGRHLGGVILPGLAMMREALLRDTRIPPHPNGDAQGAMAQDTGAAIHAGTRLAVAGAVERAYRQQQAQYPQVRLLLCGGDAGGLLPDLPDARHEPDLVLRGLLRYAAPPSTSHKPAMNKGNQ